jgi:hypothetical protein
MTPTRYMVRHVIVGPHTCVVYAFILYIVCTIDIFIEHSGEALSVCLSCLSLFYSIYCVFIFCCRCIDMRN